MIRGAPPDTVYTFKHALVRDAAYESLLKSRRQELHEKIALTMQSPTTGSPDHKAEAIAFHFARAERWTDATELFREAATATVHTFAIREALSLCQQALDAASHLDFDEASKQKLEIHRERADLFFLIGDFPNSRSEWSKMLTMAETQDDQHLMCSALAGLAAAYMWEEAFDDALAYAEKAAAAAEEIGDAELLSSAHNTTGSVQAVTGRLDTARRQLDKTIHIARSAGSAAQESRALYMRGNIENWQGNFDKAVELASAGARLARDNDFTAAFLRSNYAHAISLTGKGAYDAALNLFNEGLALAEKLGDIAFIPRYMNGLGWLYLECQGFERGFEFNQQSAEITRHGGSAIGIEMTAFAEINMADVFLRKGDLENAFDVLDGVHRICSDPVGHTWMKWRYSSHMFASMARLWLARGDVRKSSEFAEQCQVTATNTNSQKYIAGIWQLQGEIACARKDWAEAEQLFGNAAKLATAIGNPPLMVSTRTALGDFHAAAKNADKATMEYRAAREVIDQIRSATTSSELRAGLNTAPAFQRIEYLLRRP
jgi:tetratricopeptide (TPR) repeat protein